MNNIKILLKEKGVLQKEFALDIGVSQPTVSDWINNRKDPRGENLLKVAEYFGVQPEQIKIKETHDAEDLRDIDISHIRGAPRTTEARILSAGIDRMPARDRERALRMIRLMFDQYDEYFNERNDDDDT